MRSSFRDLKHEQARRTLRGYFTSLLAKQRENAAEDIERAAGGRRRGGCLPGACGVPLPSSARPAAVTRSASASGRRWSSVAQMPARSASRSAGSGQPSAFCLSGVAERSASPSSPSPASGQTASRPSLARWQQTAVARQRPAPARAHRATRAAPSLIACWFDGPSRLARPSTRGDRGAGSAGVVCLLACRWGYQQLRRHWICYH